MSETESARETVDNSNYLCRCRSCGITPADVNRLGLHDVVTVPFDNPFVPVCSRCREDIKSLTKAIAVTILNKDGEEEFHNQRNLSTLWSLRDRLLVNEVSSVFSARYSATDARIERQQGALDHHHAALDECRQVLGLDALASKKKMSQQKTGLLGALAGALLGYGIFSSKKPLEMLRMAMEKVTEALQTYGFAPPTDAPSPEDAPLD